MDGREDDFDNLGKISFQFIGKSHPQINKQIA
jgi:hypothetical protein